MIEVVHGEIMLPGAIDISDPSYDEDVWCRINNFPISTGTYECYTWTASDKETGGWGKRIARIGIRIPGYSADKYERKGMIGVDSGLAGFFNCDTRKAFDEVLNGHNSTKDVFLLDDAFFSSSGYGDGGYDVYVGYRNDLVTEVYIEFIGDDDA